MFYRRKLVFALLENFENGLEKTRLQKLVFLLTKKQKNPNYDFVPYRFGCYSYSLKADLQAMIKRDWITISERGYELKTENKYYNELRSDDKKIVDDTISLYGKMNTEQITKHTYLNFPYHAINSTIASDILPEKYYLLVQEAKPKTEETILFTLGYEGISLEEYLNRLIRNDVKLLVDVRRNPLSQKYGFSKKLLSSFCNNLGIEYLHIPEVGIDSSKRRELNTQKDYDILFDDYNKTVLEETIESQDYILRLLKKHKRIALTCFEADTCQCHRTHLAEKIKRLPTFKYKLQHI
ncbi:DUF488 domain-containing protein [Subsaximicrobium wynnwilliamsii]|uniref:DUF488 domain-containing protein n=1 Tax=Subsaximicrobium wynnwilliamsii TaxID=291179 RepID=A0A5C6ZNI6_9FLAO|nr:DUF488 domain-containing protein [Subsaximicrobium wynnwilliamsii]TXD85521.1 DUF488 domain-containing protein [Subsaximicrobium wynnwilliamsii]TXD90874.1 DUF488 domain-containing protein [Subsaximicrobium wynnwilliamsii]TXE05381.1 DUF488 domain-containing protein [Subsaximicrobium wynnwilliamsii]